MKRLLSVSVVFFLLGCATSTKQVTDQPPRQAISIMAYNVENLFDTQHDKGTEDYTYLPIEQKQSKKHRQRCEKIRSYKYRDMCLNLDWSNSALKLKMERIADVLKQVNGGRGPDVLIMEEVENMRVLKKLRDEHLNELGYQTLVLIEGFDKRGIDVAIMSRLPLAGTPELHKIPFKAANDKDKEWMNRTRGILQATLRLPDGNKLSVFAVHFPSQSNPTYWRQQAIVFLNHLMYQVPKDHVIVAGGDFNIADQEERQFQLYRRQLAEHWLVSHQIGCKNCRGTNYYHTLRSWSFLDALLFPQGMSESGQRPWLVEPASISIPNKSPYQTNRWMSPAAFDQKSAVGVSDHWPVFAVIRLRTPLVATSETDEP